MWDAEKLISGADNAFMSRTSKHSGAIKSLQFNPLKPQILATAGTKGELFIYDVNDIGNPFRLGTAAARADDLECIAWNRKVPHILATGGSGGHVAVWDLKTKKQSLSLNNNRKAVAAIAWDPNNATKLLTATPDDSSPVILLWDLRNSNAPERTLEGHEQGILSLSWCQQDSDLLLSCGKDNRTLVWNPQTGERLGEFPEVTNWTFQTRFNPHNPTLSATASFDGKISIQTLQNTNPSASQTQVQGPVDGEDFFAKAQTQPQGASFTLAKAPKWLERPVGASFGFGGKLVSFELLKSEAGTPRSSKIQISQFSVDSDVGSATESFEKALVAGDISSICETHISEAKSEEEKGDWKVIETLIAENPRKQVTEYLGFSELDETINGAEDVETEDAEKAEETKTETSGGDAVKNSRLSTLFADGVDGDDFLSAIAATKGVKTDNPFQLFTETDSATEKQITKALMLGQFEKAMTICLKEDRIADAFIIANCGGKELLDKAQSAYLSRKQQGPNYLRLLTSVIGKNLWDIVYNADLANWKESMATLCTYADPTEFPDLCEALGDRIMESGSSKDASFCYLVGSKLEKVVSIWISELEENEKAGIETLSGDSTFSVHARSLQNFIEKVTVFRDVTKFQDTEQSLSSGWKLAPLYDKYIEYADIVAAHGHLSIAERYLDLLPVNYPAAEVARNRVKLASRKGAPKVVRQEQPSRLSSRVQPVGYQPSQPSPAAPAKPATNSYLPPTPAQATNPYAPPANTYTPQQGYQQPQQGYQQPQSQAGYSSGYGGYGSATAGYGAPAPPTFGGPPPRNTTPSAPPPPRVKDMTNWNDTPTVIKPPTARRSTPQSVAPITSPFPNQNNLSMPPPGPPFGGARATPPPPPPKGSAPPRVTSPLNSGHPQAFQHPPPPRPSSAANAYAPQAPSPAQQFSHPVAPPTIPRGASPYNAPPSGPPPSNRYAPAPSSQQYSQPPASQVAPPPQAGNRPPPANPYAPQHSFAPTQSPYEARQSPSAQFQQQGHPPTSQGPPRGPPTGPPKATPPPPAAPQKPKYPSGDRSHIPESAQRVYEILSSDCGRVASKAPQSFAPQVKDTQKRLNMLFDHLNNETLLNPDTIKRLGELAEALAARDYDTAGRLQVDIQSEKTDECGLWMVSLIRNSIFKPENNQN